MADITPTFTVIQGISQIDGWKAVWGPMANGDVGIAADKFAGYADKSLQVEGTFGAAGSVAAEGSNDGTNYRTLTDPQGTVIAVTAAGMKAITEATLFMRPRVTAGDVTTALTVTMFFRRTQP